MNKNKLTISKAINADDRHSSRGSHDSRTDGRLRTRIRLRMNPEKNTYSNCQNIGRGNNIAKVIEKRVSNYLLKPEKSRMGLSPNIGLLKYPEIEYSSNPGSKVQTQTTSNIDK